MKITVDRTVNPEGDLVFTVTVKEPHVAPFSEVEKNALVSIDKFTKEMEKTLDPTQNLYQDILNANHKVKEKVFVRILENLKFSIENQLRPKFRPMCQEIYNWIQGAQEGYLKTWMIEFDPQRTRYYFDNDEEMKAQSSAMPHQREIDENDVDDEDEEIENIQV